jgi:AraC-like DNA-binding protein
MRETLRGVEPDRLERSCKQARDWIRFGTGAPGLERAEVYLSTCAFEPHRHDTYTISLTTSGVQTFRYRGARRVALPGQLVVLHPDETHDGAPGTDEGFGYRALYVAPELVHAALAGSPLPFVAETVQKASGATRRVAGLLADFEEPVGDLARVDLAATVSDVLLVLSGKRKAGSTTVDSRAVGIARDYLTTHASESAPAATLERITGLDRFTLARQFRRAFGTSPDRYRTLRRLELARVAIEDGQPLARAAVDAGFADQSHMTRQFKRAYGFTPSRWTALTASE